MNVDALTLAAIADELGEELVGARIENVIQPTPQAVALQCWGRGRNRWLLASAQPQHARIHLIDHKPRKLVVEPPPFVMLLRKHLEGARVVSIRQPRWERVIEVGFARTPAAADTAPVCLVVEIMGRLSNLILCDGAGMILGALRNVSAQVNRYRTVAPHVAYRPPPAQTRVLYGEALPRLDPETVSADALRVAADDALAAQRDPKEKAHRHASVASLVASHVTGFSRDLGEEVSARALGTVDVPLDSTVDFDAIARVTRDLASLVSTHDWQPTLVFRDTHDASVPEAFAVYTPARFPEAVLRPVADVNTLLALYYEQAEWHGAVENAKSDLRRRLRTERDRCVRKYEALRADLRALEEASRLRMEADLLLAFQSDVVPGASSFTVDNPFPAGDEMPGESITLNLDPRLSAVQNANRRYDRYHKLQRAAAQIPPQLDANTLELTRIEQLETDLALAETLPEIALVRAEIAEAGYLRGRAAGAEAHGRLGARHAVKPGTKGKQRAPQGPEGGTPLRRKSADGFILLIGKNSRQNETVTFHEASGNDVWLHARGVPGAHVIVKSGGRPVPERTLREAAALAAYYSQARAAGSVPVDHTQQRYVRHMKGGGPGMVTYEHERTLQAEPADIGVD